MRRDFFSFPSILNDSFERQVNGGGMARVYILPKIVMFFRGFLKESTSMMIFIPETKEKRYVMITLNLSTGAGYSIVYFCNFNWTTASSVIQHTQIYIGCLISVHLVLLTATSIDLFTKSEWQLLECFFLANAASCL